MSRVVSSRTAAPFIAWLAAVTLLVLAPAAGEVDPAITGIPELGGLRWWLVLAVLTAQAAVLLESRHRPLTVLPVTAGAAVVLALLGAGDATTLSAMAVLFAVWAAVTRADLPPQRQALALSLLGAGALLALGGHLSQIALGAPVGTALVAGLAQGAVVIIVPALLASVARTRREARRARADLVLAIEREHSARVAAAIAEERTAMARELHDIAAHHLTGIAVMTGAVERQIDTDPAGAKASVREVRTQTTAMLRELRGLVTLLRDHGAAEQTGPERLADLPGLVDAARRAGLEVGFELLGPADSSYANVGPLAQLSAYRTVQECLANAVRHAPGAACEVVLDATDPEAVVLTVRNGPAAEPAPAPPGAARHGLGLVGMRERADLTDSTLETGPTPDGGWHTRLRVPVAATVEVTR